jgi:hypothetical protein
LRAQYRMRRNQSQISSTARSLRTRYRTNGVRVFHPCTFFTAGPGDLVHSLSCSLPCTNRQGALGALFGSTLVSTGDTPRYPHPTCPPPPSPHPYTPPTTHEATRDPCLGLRDSVIIGGVTLLLPPTTTRRGMAPPVSLGRAGSVTRSEGRSALLDYSECTTTAPLHGHWGMQLVWWSVATHCCRV